MCKAQQTHSMLTVGLQTWVLQAQAAPGQGEPEIHELLPHFPHKALVSNSRKSWVTTPAFLLPLCGQEACRLVSQWSGAGVAQCA